MKHALFTLANKILQRFGYRAIRHPKALQVKPSETLVFTLLHELGLLHMWRTPLSRPFRFVQVGALELEGHYDVVAAARRFGEYQGLLIDAQPLAVERLTAKYGNDHSLTILHRAVTDTRGEVVFYSVNNDDHRLPDWVAGLASLDRANILKFEGDFPGLARRIVETRVDTISLADVIQCFPSLELDLLIIDTEGHDYRVLNTFPFEDLKPEIVFLEHCHLSATDREKAIGKLTSFGYRVACLESDIMATRLPYSALH